MPLTYITHTLNATERKAVRDEIIELFLLESPGTGKEELCSKYEYTVETIDEYSIYLKRPASLNKGFDFTVHVKGMNFKKNRTYSNPSHSDILNILVAAKNALDDNYEIVRSQINNLYNNNSCDLAAVSGFYFLDHLNEQRPLAIILLAIKWLFIEQDMTYWNWSGRAMLFSRLAEENLV